MKPACSHSFELGWLEGAARAALLEIECENPAEAIKKLRYGLDEAERKAAFERNCVVSAHPDGRPEWTGKRAQGPHPDPRDPDPSRPGIFRDYNCWKCDDGKKPCVKGHPHRCDYPHARND